MSWIIEILVYLVGTLTVLVVAGVVIDRLPAKVIKRLFKPFE